MKNEEQKKQEKEQKEIDEYLEYEKRKRLEDEKLILDCAIESMITSTIL